MDDRFGEMLDSSPDARTRYFDLLARMYGPAVARRIASFVPAARG